MRFCARHDTIGEGGGMITVLRVTVAGDEFDALEIFRWKSSAETDSNRHREGKVKNIKNDRETA